MIVTLGHEDGLWREFVGAVPFDYDNTGAVLITTIRTSTLLTIQLTISSSTESRMPSAEALRA